jgi:methionyl aminopeptidase
MEIQHLHFLLERDPDEAKKLLQVTFNSLFVGIEKAVVGNRIGDIGFAIQELLRIHP